MKNENGGSPWFGKVEAVVASFLKGLAGGFAEQVKDRIREFIAKVQKNLAGLTLVMIGTIFALVGLAKFINDLVDISDGMGYAVVGLVVLLTGLIIIKK